MQTVYLGQFTWEHANAIAEQFQKAGIEWWHKQAGGFVQTLFKGDWGVRLYVDRARLDEAKAIAAEVQAGNKPAP